MTKKEKRIMTLAVAFAFTFGVMPVSYAMHIMEGYLPLGYCLVWGAVCVPFLAAGFFSIRRTLGENRKNITVLAMAGAFIFVISSLKIPSVTGSCSHMTGTGLGGDPVWAVGSEHPWNYRIDFPGGFTGTWGTHHAGCQYLLYGDCWSVRGFWDL